MRHLRPTRRNVLIGVGLTVGLIAVGALLWYLAGYRRADTELQAAKSQNNDKITAALVSIAGDTPSSVQVSLANVKKELIVPVKACKLKVTLPVTRRLQQDCTAYSLKIDKTKMAIEDFISLSAYAQSVAIAFKPLTEANTKDPKAMADLYLATVESVRKLQSPESLHKHREKTIKLLQQASVQSLEIKEAQTISSVEKFRASSQSLKTTITQLNEAGQTVEGSLMASARSLEATTSDL